MKCVSVIGLGRVGLPLALFIAERGYKVIGVDIDKKKCEILNKKVNIFDDEPGIEGLLKKHAGINFIATSDYSKTKECNFHVIIVPLLIDKNKNPDFKILQSATESLAKNIKRGDIIVVETTLPPLTTEEKVKKWLEEKSGLKCGKDFYLAYSPERIAAGVVLDRLKNFPKIIGGVDKKSGEIAYEFYKKIIPNLSLVSSSKVAEMAKLMEGAYRDVNIALANQLFKLCEDLKIDFYEARDKANHAYCNLHLPGVGVGGHCIPVYPWFLIKKEEEANKYENTTILRVARKTNDEMVYYWYYKIIEKMVKKGIGKNGKIAIKGISFRKNIKSTTNSKALELAYLLKSKGFEVRIKDKLYNKEEIERMGFKESTGDEDIVFNTYKLKFED